MPLLPVGVRSVDQVAIVVWDLDRALGRSRPQLGIGPWDVGTYGPNRRSRLTFRGHDHPDMLKLGLASVGPTMYELIESVSGPSIYDEFLQKRGEGLHHFGYVVDDIDQAIAPTESRGYVLLQSGRHRTRRPLPFPVHPELERLAVRADPVDIRGCAPGDALAGRDDGRLQHRQLRDRPHRRSDQVGAEGRPVRLPPTLLRSQLGPLDRGSVSPGERSE